MTGSEHMLHVGGKASALSSFSLEEQKEIEQSPQRWCGGSDAQRTPLWSWESASEHTQHSTEAMAANARRTLSPNLRKGGKGADSVTLRPCLAAASQYKRGPTMREG